MNSDRSHSAEAQMAGLLEAAPRRTIHPPDSGREWLVANGLGGYASGTVSGRLSRRYHGLLIAAPHERLDRFMMLNSLDASLECPDGRLLLIGEQTFYDRGEVMPLAEFRLEEGLPVWMFRSNEYAVEKRLLLNQGQNTMLIKYALVSRDTRAKLLLRPGINFRGHDNPVGAKLKDKYEVHRNGDCCEISAIDEALALRLRCEPPGAFFPEVEIVTIVLEAERVRGYDFEGSLYSPGFFAIDLAPGEEATLTASSESGEVMESLTPEEARERALQRRRALLQRAPPPLRTGFAASLILAADQFIFHPPGRRKEEVWARAAGDEVRTVIAGYHWFGDWGRDTMVSLEGLTLTTGRHTGAGWILRTFAHYIKDGLIPNLFPEGQEHGLYHTADASLWFFYALARYLHFTHDFTTLRLLMPRLQEMMDAHLRGTRFGIKADPADGLLSQGAEGYQLTWMDAKAGDWVVTPRRGKAVEINALWYNALCCMSDWMNLLDREKEREAFGELARRARDSFNRRFWSHEAGYLFDVVDGESGDDLSCRPNQIFAISLPHAVLDREYWEPVLETVTRELLTPVGLRSLSPRDPNYKSQYYGDLRSRDAAYHQGSVWAWLIGGYVDTWIKAHPERPSEARKFLQGFVSHLDEACVGSISEIFDGDAPHTPRGCIAEAWSVAEVLRCWAKTCG
ncbi:MAG TPA: amylo-alpha-1,6-glucosidase [Bryobacteraceae bacterium]